jgi:hypothetical protein
MTKQERMAKALEDAKALRVKRENAIAEKVMGSEGYLNQLNLQADIDDSSTTIEAMKQIIDDHNKIVSKDKQARMSYVFGYSRLVDSVATIALTALYSKSGVREQLKSLSNIPELISEQISEAFKPLPYFSTVMLDEYPTLNEVSAHIEDYYEVPSASDINTAMELASLHLGYIIPPVTQHKCDTLYKERLNKAIALAESSIDMLELKSEIEEDLDI